MLLKKSMLLLMLASIGLACNNTEFKGRADTAKETITASFTQASYPDAQTVHKQGFSGEPQTENFAQGSFGALDLLIVVDNSGSMAEEQVNLATKLDPLLSQIDRADWQIAVVTTDPADGCQRALIKKSDPDAAARFSAAINAGVKGSGEERGILQAVNGLRGDCLASPWIRPGSTVSVLIVSDEDNCHLDENLGYGCKGDADRSASYLGDYLASIRKPGKDARVYGLIWHPSTPKSDCPVALKQGIEYAKLIDETGGKWGSICDADYSTTLAAISADIAEIIKYDFELKETPDDGTLVVTVDGEAWTDYTVDGLKLTFTVPPPFGAKIDVSYKIGKDGDVAKEFKLDKAPVDGTIKVTVNGEEVDSKAYTWDPTKKVLVFADQPEDKADIEIAYKELTQLASSFDIGKTADPKTIAVKVAGIATTTFSYDPATGLVTITPTPAEGAQIEIAHR